MKMPPEIDQATGFHQDSLDSSTHMLRKKTRQVINEAAGSIGWISKSVERQDERVLEQRQIRIGRLSFTRVCHSVNDSTTPVRK